MILRYWSMLCLLLVFCYSCEQDDIPEQQQITIKDNNSTNDSVSEQDIPEVMSYVTSLNKGNGDFNIVEDQGDGSTRDHTQDIVLTKLLTNQISKLTNSAGKSNYTFRLLIQSGINDNSFYNLVVKDYIDSYYSYIVKYTPEDSWYEGGEFNGGMYFYTSEGIYVGHIDILEGMSVSSNFSSRSCEQSGGSSTGGGGDTGNGDGSGNPSGTGTTGTGSSGSGGGTISVCGTYTIGGTADNQGNTKPPRDILICEYIPVFKLMGSILRTGCPPIEECHDNFGDPCSCNESGDGCLSNEDNSEIENNDVGINIDIGLIGEINQYLASPLTLNQIQLIYANENAEESIRAYLEFECTNGTCQDEIIENIEEYIAIIENLPEAKLEKYIELKDLLEEDPFALIEIDCDQIENWQVLAQHTAPQSIIDKFNELNDAINSVNDFEIQSLENAGGSVINLDYFTTTISTLPINPETGNQYTPEGFLDFFRRNINVFANEDTSFGPYCEASTELCDAETELWFSNDPEGSIIYINIAGDDGVVVCSEYTNTHWNFMTINAPVAGNHPVSGTRQFGIETLSNGSINIYVRGVDRIDSSPFAFFGSSIMFGGADDLWRSFQNNILNYVESEGGTGFVVNPTRNRPDYETVREVLKGERPISDLGCN